MAGGVHLGGEAIIGRVPRHQASGKTGHMGQGIQNGHRPVRLDQPDGSVGLPLTHLQGAPFADVPVHRVGELERPPFVQLHQGERRDRLGHRVDAPDRVVADRRGALSVHETERPPVSQSAATGHRHLASRDLSSYDVTLLEVFGEALEASGVEAGTFRIDLHAQTFRSRATSSRSRGTSSRDRATSSRSSIGVTSPSVPTCRHWARPSTPTRG